MSPHNNVNNNVKKQKRKTFRNTRKKIARKSKPRKQKYVRLNVSTAAAKLNKNKKINKVNCQIQEGNKKYWYQRLELFSKFNKGIKLDDESWYSCTPEKIAIQIAQRCKTNGTIIDAMCGCGGNTIQFAKTCGKVIAIDIDPIKIQYAKHNAKIYGVQKKIEFIVGNFMDLDPKLYKADVVYLGPPWGGPEYSKIPVYDIKINMPINGYELFNLAEAISPNIAYSVPRNVDRNQMKELAEVTKFLDIQENRFNDKVKMFTVYYGNLVKQNLLETTKL